MGEMRNPIIFTENPNFFCTTVHIIDMPFPSCTEEGSVSPEFDKKYPVPVSLFISDIP